jgi:hypothetical protein
VWDRPLSPRPVPPARSTDVRVLLADRFLARQVEHNGARAGISRVAIRSAPPARLIADMQWSPGLSSVPMVVVAQPVAEGGKLHLAILAAQLGGVSIPPSVAQAVSDGVTTSLQRPLGSNARIVTVRVVRQGVLLSANYTTP